MAIQSELPWSLDQVVTTRNDASIANVRARKAVPGCVISLYVTDEPNGTAPMLISGERRPTLSAAVSNNRSPERAAILVLNPPLLPTVTPAFVAPVTGLRKSTVNGILPPIARAAETRAVVELSLAMAIIPVSIEGGAPTSATTASPCSFATYSTPPVSSTSHALPPMFCRPMIDGAVLVLTSMNVAPAVPSAVTSVEPAAATPRVAPPVELTLLKTGWVGS